MGGKMGICLSPLSRENALNPGELKTTHLY
jgi:hypothetical protein